MFRAGSLSSDTGRLEQLLDLRYPLPPFLLSLFILLLYLKFSSVAGQHRAGSMRVSGGAVTLASSAIVRPGNRLYTSGIAHLQGIAFLYVMITDYWFTVTVAFFPLIEHPANPFQYPFYYTDD